MILCLPCTMLRFYCGILELFILTAWFSRVLCIDCFVCSSNNGSDPHCGDPFHPVYGVYVKDCKQGQADRIGLFPAKYCIKLIGTNTVDGSQMSFRGCSLTSLDSVCSEFKFEGKKYRGCVTSCMEDGCNGSEAVSFHNFYFITAMVILLCSIL